MSASVTLSSTGQSNQITYSWTPANFTKDDVASMTLFITDVAQSSSSQLNAIFARQIIPIVDPSTQLLTTTYVATGLTNGKKYLATLQIDFKPASWATKGKSISSSGNLQNPSSPPIQPIFNLASGDGNLYVNLTNMDTTLYPGNDGFSPITQVVVLLADGSQNMFARSYYATDFSNINADVITVSGLTNAIQYEVALYCTNSVGQSVLSQTQVSTPTDKPNILTNVTAYSTIASNQLASTVNQVDWLNTAFDLSTNVYYGFRDASNNVKDATSVSIFWNGPDDNNDLNNTNLSITGYVITRNEFVYDPSASGNYRILTGTTTTFTPSVDPSGNPSRIRDPSGNWNKNFSLTLSDTGNKFAFRYVDTSTTVGKFYKYSVAATNSNGTGPIVFTQSNGTKVEATTGIVKCGSLPSTPVIGIDPSAASIRLRLLSAGSLNGFTKANYYYTIDASGIDVSANLRQVNNVAGVLDFSSSLPTTTDSSGRVLYGYDISRNAVIFKYLPTVSGQATLSQFNYTNSATGSGATPFYNGVTYTINLYAQTTDSTLGTTFTFRSVPLVIKSTPYVAPDFPENVRVLAVDASKNPLNSRFNVSFDTVYQGRFYPTTAARSSTVTKSLGGSYGPVKYSIYISSSPSDASNIMQPVDPSANNLLSTFVSKIAASFDQSGNPTSFTSLQNGTLYFVYARTLVYNTEIGQWISSIDSQPTRFDTPITYPTPVANLVLKSADPSANMLLASWDANTVENGGGFVYNPIGGGATVSNIRYKLILTDLSTNAVIPQGVVNAAAGAITDASGLTGLDASGNLMTKSSSVVLTGVTPGKPYKLVVWNQGIYQSTDTSFNVPPGPIYGPNNPAIITPSTASKSVAIPYAAPLAPRNMIYYPMNSAIRVTWDTPLDASVNAISQGVTLNSYDIIAKSATSTYVAPYATIDKLQPSYVTKINNPLTPLTESIVLNKYTDPSNTFTNIVNGSRYIAGVRAVGTIGGYTLNGETLSLQTIQGVIGQYTDSSTVPIQVQPGGNVSQPANLTASSSAGTVAVSWNKVAGASQYHVYQDDELIAVLAVTGESATPFKFYNPITGVTEDENSTSYRNVTTPNTSPKKITYTNNSIISVSIEGLENGRSYVFGVVTIQSGLQSIMSTISGTPFTQPTVVTNIKYTVSDSQIKFNWTPPSNNGGANVAGNGPLRYKLTLYTDLSGELTDANATNLLSTWNTTVQGTPVSDIAEPEYTFASLTNGKYYKVEIIAYYLIGGDPTNPASSIPDANSYALGIVPNPPPQDVSGVTITTSDRNVVLKWENPTDQGLYPRDYIILTRTVTNESGVVLPDMSFNIELSANIVTYVDTSVNNLSSINVSGTTNSAGLISYIYNGNTYTYKIVSHHTKGIQAQQPSGKIVFGVPSGNPIFWTQVFPSGDKKTFSMVVNKNGSNLQKYIVIGTPDPSSGLTVPILEGNFTGAIYSNSADSNKSLASNQNTSWTFTMPTTVDALFVVVTNANGVTTGTWPLNSIKFRSIVDA